MKEGVPTARALHRAMCLSYLKGLEVNQVLGMICSITDLSLHNPILKSILMNWPVLHSPKAFSNFQNSSECHCSIESTNSLL